MKESLKKVILANRGLTKMVFYFRKLYLGHKMDIHFGHKSLIGFSSTCEGNHSFGTNSLLLASSIGFGSYIGPDSKIINAKIGRFSSIGPNVNCIIGKHPSNTFVSTHPAFFSLRQQAGFTYTQKQMFDEFEKPVDPEGKYSILIGNDVWIGSNVSLMDGIRIGDGAIIAANALVTKDVPPYTIVAGVPAKIKKRRFEEDKIEFLLRFKWWEKNESWIRANADKFIDIEKFHLIFKNEQ